MNALVPVRQPGWPCAGPGRPSTATPELKIKILERLADGGFLSAMCREEGMPSSRTVYRWMEEDEEFASQFAQARELGALAWIEEGVETANRVQNGRTITYKSDGTVEMRVADAVDARRLKSDVFMKAAALVCRDKFGAKAIAASATVASQGEDGKLTVTTLRMVEETVVTVAIPAAQE